MVLVQAVRLTSMGPPPCCSLGAMRELGNRESGFLSNGKQFRVQALDKVLRLLGEEMRLGRICKESHRKNQIINREGAHVNG